MSAGAETFLVELEREDDGRWLAEVVDVPGALAYGASAGEAAGLAVDIAVAGGRDQRLEDEADGRAAQEALDEMARTGEKPISLEDVKRALKLATSDQEGE